jgi:hypothetical protein
MELAADVLNQADRPFFASAVRKFRPFSPNAVPLIHSMPSGDTLRPDRPIRPATSFRKVCQMAKGQKKSSREAKKPKADKKPAAEKTSSAHSFLTKPTTGKSGK